VRSCGVHGIVYFAPKFCDHAYYDFAELKRHVGESEGLPMLLLEGEYGSARSGQTLTRVTAFREMLEGRLGLR
ncbi:MAG: 2-hydroxyacyl-CoA dehydratase family protein, partial [Bacillota bacterium]